MTHQTYFVLDIESGLEWTSYINGKQAERDEDGSFRCEYEMKPEIGINGGKGRKFL